MEVELKNLFKSYLNLKFYFNKNKTILKIESDSQIKKNKLNLYNTKNEFKCVDISLINSNILLNIKNIICKYCEIYEINLDYFLNLKYLDCENNKLTSLYINNIDVVYCSNNILKNITFSKNSSCIYLDCSYNILSTLNFNNNLSILVCSNNFLNEININNLKFLNCSYNNITQINFNENRTLISLESLENKFKNIYIPYDIKKLNIDGKNLEFIYVNKITKNIKKKNVLNLKKFKIIKIHNFLTYINDIEETEEKCSLCLDYLKHNLCEIKCKHRFHVSCINYLNIFICPYCRQKMW